MAPESLRDKILDKLHGHTEINAEDIEIFVKDGLVSINGSVDGPNAKSTIEALVASVTGVIDVVNYLKLRRPFESGDGDGLHEGVPGHE